MRRARPSRPNPQSVESTRRSGGTYSSAERISPATNSGGSTAAVEWFTTPMAIFLSVRNLARRGRSRPLVDAHSSVITSAFVWSRYGKDRSYDGRSQCSGCWLGFPPARVEPDLRLHAGDLTVDRLREELEILVGGRPVGPRDVMLGLLDLDHAAARGRHFLELGVEDIGEGQDEVTVRRVVAVHEHLGERLAGDGAEL